jgi:hypothetical protein
MLINLRFNYTIKGFPRNYAMYADLKLPDRFDLLLKYKNCTKAQEIYNTYLNQVYKGNLKIRLFVLLHLYLLDARHKRSEKVLKVACAKALRKAINVDELKNMYDGYWRAYSITNRTNGEEFLKNFIESGTNIVIS